MEFERLLAEISTFFINLPSDRIDSEIKDAQRRVCERLHLDRSTLFQVSRRKPGTLLLTHLHQPPESVKPPEKMDIQDLWPWSLKKVLQGETLIISRINDLPAEADCDRQSFLRYGTQSMVGVPLSAGGGDVFGLLTFAVVGRERHWPEAVVRQFELVAQIFANALVRKHTEQALGEQLAEIQRLKQKLEQENIYLRDEIMLQYGHNEIVGRSNAMKRVLAQVEQVAGTDATVLLSGETGTGKELLARTIHSLSKRKGRPLVTINCAVLPPTLIESELFGREKGAYTGALTRMAGRFEVADRSTLFLDEVGELPLDLQAKLLRVLEEGRFERLGSTNSLQADVRIIAATNVDLAEQVAAGSFREDLYFRLRIIDIHLPLLRERDGDIVLLANHFLQHFTERLGKKFTGISEQRKKNIFKRYGFLPWDIYAYISRLEAWAGKASGCLCRYENAWTIR